MASTKTTGGPAVSPIVNLPPSVSAPPAGSQSEWTTIPTRPPVRFPKLPTAPTQHMLLLTTKYARGPGSPSVWSCFECTAENPPRRYPERREATKRMFTAAGTFFAERGIVLSSLNICSFGVPVSKTLELFFKSEEALWEADALVEEFSATFGGGLLRRLEDGGKMVIFGVLPMPFTDDDFHYRMNLNEEHLRALEDLNPVFTSTGERLTYRIRNVHYMSSQSTEEVLEKYGRTWSVTFNDFRVAEFFIEEGGFYFFGEARGPLRWYENRPEMRRWNPPPAAGGKQERAGSQASLRNGEPAHNGKPVHNGESVAGESANIEQTADTGKNIQAKVEGSKPQEAIKTANGAKGQEAAAAATSGRPKSENTPVIYTAGKDKGAVAVTTGQQNMAEVKGVCVAGAQQPEGDPKAGETAQADEAAKAAADKQLKKKNALRLRNQKKKEKEKAAKAAAKLAAAGGAQEAGGAVASSAITSAPRQG